MAHGTYNRFVVMGLIGCLSMINVSLLAIPRFLTMLPPYSASGIIGQKHTEIRNESINCSSRAVSQRGTGEKSLSVAFKKYLKTEFMQKVREIYYKKGGCGTALGAIQIKEAVAQELEKKEEALIAERDSCQMKQITFVVGAVVVAGAGLYLYNQVGRNRQHVNNAQIRVGLTTGLSSGCFVAYAAYLGFQKGWINDHIPQVHAMRKDWQAFYEPGA